MSDKAGQRGFRLKSALEADGATMLGVTFDMRCNLEGFELPTSVVLMAEVGFKPRAMARIDINGSRHENRPAICGVWQHLDAGPTHFHDPRLHASIPMKDLFDGTYGDLPVARPIRDMPLNFAEAMEKCAELLHIEDLAKIEEPQWQPRQFLF